MKTQRKILVVDDDPVVGKSFERVLTSKGYAVINCSSGVEALEKLGKEEYDAVFTDLKMPGMDGMEVATRVKASQPWMPVVIVTGYGSPVFEEQANNIGVSDSMRKPLSPEMIEESADKAMRAKEAVMEIMTEEVVQPAVVEEKAHSNLVNVMLFLSAPFIGLLYALFMPIIGLGMLAYLAYKAAAKNDTIAFTAKWIAAPFIGLAYAVGLPFFGIGAIIWTGLKAAFK